MRRHHPLTCRASVFLAVLCCAAFFNLVRPIQGQQTPVGIVPHNIGERGYPRALALTSAVVQVVIVFAAMVLTRRAIRSRRKPREGEAPAEP